MYLTEKQKSDLEYFDFPIEIKIELTRKIKKYINNNFFYSVQLVNNSNLLRGKESYVPIPFSDGSYSESEYLYIDSSLNNIFLLLDNKSFIELIAEYIDKELIDVDDVNKIFKDYDIFIKFEYEQNNNSQTVKIEFLDMKENLKTKSKVENLNHLMIRMENALINDDYSLVLHTASCIFETMAKKTINNRNIETQPFGSFFEKYRKESKLPKEILDFILRIYKERNTEPLAAHGSTKQPLISKEEAIILFEFTKTIVKINNIYNPIFL